MAIFDDTFSVYERLASAKMRSLVTEINGHTHDGSYGPKIPFTYLDGYIGSGQIPNDLITGAMILDGTITTTNIGTGQITYNHFDTALQALFASDGTSKYACYAP